MKEKLKNYFAQEILSYLSGENEKLLFVGKPAGIILIPQFIVLCAVAVFSYISLHYLTLVLYKMSFWYVIGIILIAVLATLFMVAITIDWLFDFYIVTTRKIINLQYAPPFSHNLSSILLDQVRCTEVDTQKNGILNELFDIGDVTITFDRPTHQEAFTFHRIYHPERVSLYLGKALTNPTEPDIKPFWYKEQGKINRFKMGEDISKRKKARYNLYYLN